MTLDRATLNELYRYCYSLTGNEASAYDLLQDGLERFLRLDRAIDAPIPYLRRLLRNLLIDQQRHRQRYPEQSLEDTSDQQLDNTLGIGLQLLENESIAARDLQTIWAVLSAPEREILYLWAQQGMTAAEIATQTDASRNTVLSRIHRLRQKLRRRFGDLRRPRAQSWVSR